jgi:hypothetical protein
MIGSKVFKVFIIIFIFSSFFILFEKEINFSGGLLREEAEAEELSYLASAVFGGEGEGEVFVEADLVVAVIVVVDFGETVEGREAISGGVKARWETIAVFGGAKARSKFVMFEGGGVKAHWKAVSVFGGFEARWKGATFYHRGLEGRLEVHGVAEVSFHGSRNSDSGCVADSRHVFEAGEELIERFTQSAYGSIAIV